MLGLYVLILECFKLVKNSDLELGVAGVSESSESELVIGRFGHSGHHCIS